MLHDVPVIKHHMKRHSVAAFGNHRKLQIARHRAIQQAKSILTGTHICRWFEQPIDSHPVTQKAISVKYIKK